MSVQIYPSRTPASCNARCAEAATVYAGTLTVVSRSAYPEAVAQAGQAMALGE